MRRIAWQGRDTEGNWVGGEVLIPTASPWPVLNLDHEGKTVPTTDHTPPSGAVFMSTNGNDSNAGTAAAPVRTLRRAVSLVPAGGTIVVRGGVYRDWHSNAAGTDPSIISKSLTIQAYPGEQVWFDGSDVVTNWVKEGDLWWCPWETPSFCGGQYYQNPPGNQGLTGPCHYGANGTAGDPQMVFVDGKRRWQTASKDAVDTASFYHDRTNRRIYIAVDPSEHLIEIAKRPNCLVLGGGSGPAQYVVRGIGFRRFATNQYLGNLTAGAVYCGGGSNPRTHIIEDCVFKDMAGHGMFVYGPRNGSRITRCAFVDNGACGLTGDGTVRQGIRNDLLIEDCLFRTNNWEGFTCSGSCVVAGMKLSHMLGTKVRGCIAEHNLGHAWGFWWDLNCQDTEITYSLARYNGRAGIFLEVGERSLVASCLAIGNDRPGITSADCQSEIWHCASIDNQAAYHIYDDIRDRAAGDDAGPSTARVRFCNNVGSGGDHNFMMWSSDSPNSHVPSTNPDQFYDELDYNLWHRNGVSNIYRWQQDDSDVLYALPGDLYVAKGLGAHDVSVVSNPFHDLKYRVKNWPGRPLPAHVAEALGVAEGSVHDRGVLDVPLPSWT